MPTSALIHIKKVKSPKILLDALKHNLRRIERETSVPSHIVPERSAANLVLHGGDDPQVLCREAVSLVRRSTGKKLRANGIFAVEVVISLPVNTTVDQPSFFKATLEWLRDYWNCPVISAIVHFDEANPHLHVLVLPLREGRMIGAAVVGFKPELAAFKKSHHIEVGGHFGLSLVEPIPRFKRYASAKKIIACLQDHPEWLNQPSIETALLSAIAVRPAELLSVLGLDPEFG